MGDAAGKRYAIHHLLCQQCVLDRQCGGGACDTFMYLCDATPSVGPASVDESVIALDFPHFCGASISCVVVSAPQEDPPSFIVRVS